MKVLIDTNILIDVFLDRKELAENSKKVLLQIECGTIKGVLAAHSIPTLYYILNRKLGHQKTIEIITDLLNLFHIGELNNKVFISSLNLIFDDYEDALVAEIAHRENCKYIITHNIKDFKKSPITAIEPQKFLRQKLG